MAEFAAGLEDSPILNEPASAPEVAVTEVVSDAAISDPATNGDQLQLDLGDGNIGDEQLKLDLGTTTASDVEAKDTAVTDEVIVAEVVPTVDPVVAVSEIPADSDVSGDEAPTYKPD